MNKYKVVVYPVKWRRLEELFTCAKMMKSTCTIIPQCLWQNNVYDSIVGISDGKIDLIHFKLNCGDVWNKPRNLSHIAFLTKYIQQFTIYCKNNNVQHDELDLVCHEYTVNGEKQYVGIGLYPKDNREISIPLIRSPYECLRLIDETVNKFNGSNIVSYGELTNDEKFRSIVDAKVDMGAQLWIVEKDNKKYPVYVSSNIMKINKGDRISYELKNNIPMQKDITFMVRFEILKGRGNIYTYLNLVNVFER